MRGKAWRRALRRNHANMSRSDRRSILRKRRKLGSRSRRLGFKYMS